MDLQTGRTAAGSLTRLGLAGEITARFRLPASLDWRHTSDELIDLFRAPGRSIDAEVKARPRGGRPVAQTAAEVAAARVAAVRDVDSASTTSSLSMMDMPGRRRGSPDRGGMGQNQHQDIDFDVDIGGGGGGGGGEQQPHFGRVEVGRGDQSPQSDRSSFMGERLDSLALSFDGTEAAGGAPLSAASSRRSRLSLAGISAAKRRCVVLGKFDRTRFYIALDFIIEHLGSLFHFVLYSVSGGDRGVGGDELDFDVRLGEPELGGSSLPEVIVESEVPQERDLRYFVSRATHIFRDRLGKTELEKNAKVWSEAQPIGIEHAFEYPH